MDIILLAITIVSLVVALVMSMAAWRLTRDEKARSAARVAALSLASSAPEAAVGFVGQGQPAPRVAPWAPSPSMREETPRPVAAVEMPLNQPVRASEPTFSHASGFLGATEVEHDSGGRQKSLALAAVALFVVLSGGLVWMMSGPRGTSAVAVGPNSPLELVSLSHARQNEKLAVSGLVRNPVQGQPVEKLSAVVFLFDRTGTFISSSRANVDFLKLGAGDESPFVVSLEAPATVARYRVSFRTDEGVIPHIDRRGASPAPAPGEQPINVTLK
jgi:hypothetical protein